MKTTGPIRLAAIAAIIITYISFRFWNLTASCLWFDEIFSVHAAEHSWDTLLSFIAQDLIHPPLFYVLLKLWIVIGGESVFWLRSLPVLFSVLALIPLLYLCREIKLNFWTQVLTLLFLAVNGSLIKYSQEVRMYSLLFCLALFSMWLFARYFNTGKRFIPLVIVNVLLAYTHYFGWFVVLTEVLAILIYQRIKVRRILLMFTIVFVSFLPWLFTIWRASRINSDLGQNIGWMSRPGMKQVIQFVLNLLEPFYYQASSIEPISILRITIPILLIVIVATVARFATRTDNKDPGNQSVNLLVSFAAIPLLLAFVASWLLPYSIWGTRHLIIVFAPISILIAATISEIKSQTFKTVAITLIILLIGYAFTIQATRETPQYIWCAWEKLVDSVETSGPSKIYVFEDLVAYHLWFALRDHKDVEVIKVENVPGLTEDKAYFLPRGFDGVKRTDFDVVNDDRIWVAFRTNDWDESKPPLIDFTSRGYASAEKKSIESDGIHAFLVSMQKLPK